MSVRSMVDEVAIDDLDLALSNVNDRYHLSPKLEWSDLNCEEDTHKKDDKCYCVKYFANMCTASDDVKFDQPLEYYVKDDEITGSAIEDLEKAIYANYCKAKGIKASTYVSAADDTEDFGESIDDLADSLEDVQDSIEDVDIDDPSIEIDNNITGHYIAECAGCGEVFISAVMESDQQIDHITGICPICEKETDQYLKWVIKDANYKEQEDMQRFKDAGGVNF